MIRWSVAVVLVLCFAVSARAQGAQVTGMVVDESGAGVPGASVQLAGPSNRVLTTSGIGGTYEFSNVAPGTYELTATIVGFAQATAGNVVVGAAAVSAPNLTLKLASL